MQKHSGMCDKPSGYAQGFIKHSLVFLHTVDPWKAWYNIYIYHRGIWDDQTSRPGYVDQGSYRVASNSHIANILFTVV